MACQWGQVLRSIEIVRSRRGAHRSREALGQRSSRMFQRTLDHGRLRMSLSENALPRFRNGFKRLHGLAEIGERGGVVLAERPRVKPPHLERESMKLSENAPRHGHDFAQQRLGFFEAL